MSHADYGNDHALFRSHYKIVKRWLAKQGKLIRNERGELFVSDEDWRSALDAHDAETLPSAALPDKARRTKKRPKPLPVEFVEPGTGDLVAAILCPGPSLPDTWPKGGRLEGYDIVVAVNNAGQHAPCEWWCSQDPGPLKDYECHPSEGLLTSGANAQTFEGDRSFMPKGWTAEEMDGLKIIPSNKMTHPKAPRKYGWSTTNAMILAARLGAKRIDLYGDDKTGNRYFDGVTNKATKQGRWDREIKNQADLVGTLEKAGVTVRNVRPETETTEADS